MGAMAELRPIIVIGSFMALVVLLISIMPSGFFTSNASTVTPANTNFYNVLGTNDTTSYNLTGSTHDFGNRDFGGWHTNLEEVMTGSDYALWFQIADAWYTYFYSREDFTWFDLNNVQRSIRVDSSTGFSYSSHIVLLISAINNSYHSGNTSALVYTVKSSRTTMKTFFSFDLSTYSDPLAAYLAGHLDMIVGINFNERNTQINAWSVIGSFLTFQLIPNCEPTIALIVEIPFWFAELYVVFIMVLRVIGALFGGGA